MNRILPLKQLLFLLFLFLFQAGGNCFNINSKITTKIEKALDSNSEITWVNVISRRPRVYFAATFKNLNHSFDEVYEVLNDYRNMPDVFKFINKFEKIETDTNYTKKGDFYFETRSGFIRTWCILDIDSIVSGDSSTCYAIHYSTNKDEKLINKFEKEEKGFLTVEIDGYYISLYIKKIEENKSRVGITFIVVKPEIYIPRRLYKFLTKKWVPGLIDNINKYLIEKNKR